MERLRRSDWRALAGFLESALPSSWPEAAKLGAALVLERVRCASAGVYALRAEGLECVALVSKRGKVPGAEALEEAVRLALARRGVVRAQGILAVPFPGPGRPRGAVAASGVLRLSASDQALFERVGKTLSLKSSESPRTSAQGGGTELLRSLFDGVPAGLLAWDTAGRLLAANPRAEAILRKSLQPKAGQALRDLVREREGFLEGITAVNRSDKPLTRQSMVINLEGDPRTIGYSGAPLPGPDGKPRAFVLLFQDISAFVSV